MDPFRTPTAIGRYQVLSRLGKGAMGVVFSARDDRLGRDVAIKIMNTGLDDEPDTRARFFREAQVTSKLLHRNIVTVFDLGEDSGRPFIVMELLKGKTMNQALKESMFQTLESKLDLMVQLCDGLSKAHSAGVIHRDIKPSNLFILPDGSLKILDFGIARLASSNMTRAGLVVGTPDFMSPEQARGAEVDERSDVFSAAAVFYNMVTGRRPFPAPDVATSLRRVIKDDPDPMSPEEAPPPLAAVITRALSKDPAARFQRCADMAADLVRFKRNFETETRRIGGLARAQYDEANRVVNAIRDLVQTASVVPEAWVEELRRTLETKFSYFASATGGTGHGPTPVRRAQLVEVNAELQGMVKKLSAELKRLEAESAERVKKLDVLAEQTDNAIRARQFDRADELLAEGAIAGMPAGRLRPLQVALTDARLAASAMEAARAACARGEWDAAIAELESVSESRPELGEIRAELDRLKREHARLQARAATEREAAEQAREAARLIDLGDFGGAVAAADRALALVPAEPEATRLRADAVRRLEQQAQAAVTTARARSHVKLALRHIAMAQFEKAVTEAESAAQLGSGDSRTDAVLKEARRLRDAAGDARQAMIAARDREREVSRLVAASRSLLARGESATALRDAEHAVRLDPAHADAVHALDHVKAFLALMADDEDDTLSLATDEVRGGQGLARFVGQAGEVVSDVGRRLSERFRNRRG